MATSTTYNRVFWNVMKGKEENNQNLVILQIKPAYLLQNKLA